MNGKEIFDIDPDNIKTEELSKVTFLLMKKVYKLQQDNKDLSEDNHRDIFWLKWLYGSTIVMFLIILLKVIVGVPI